MQYEGWANYHTWNVALWISNTEEWYNLARAYALLTDTPSYRDFIAATMSEQITPDGVSWTDPYLDHNELDRFIAEIGQ